VEIEEGFLTYVTLRARMRREGKGRVTAVRNDVVGGRIGLVAGLYRQGFM
jgi:hypothetical protein